MSPSAPSQLGYLLVGHGTRDPVGQAEFREVERLVAERLQPPVVGAFLELAEPTIAQGLAELCRRGVRRVFVAPLLLFSAGHAKEDVPGEVADAAAKLGMEIVGQSGALELHPQLLELSRLRFRDSIDGLEREAPNTRMLLVGRGGSELTALDMMRRYTDVLSASLGVVGGTAFAALARPSVAEALQRLAEGGATQVTVQPHLLFTGEVLQAIAGQVTEARAAFPHVRWILSGHLGAHPLLVDAIVGRLAAASPHRPTCEITPGQHSG